MRRLVGCLAVLAACGGGDCPPVTASSGDLRVVVTAEDGCGGRTWQAEVTFPDGRTQALAGQRDGLVTAALLGDISGDSLADLVITAEPSRVYAFVRTGNIFFGRELPPPPGQGGAGIHDGALWAGDQRWDPAAGAWQGPS